MGKKSKKYPEYSTGSISVNGNTVATTKRDKDNNVVSSSYNMSATEKKIYDSIQKNMYSSLSNLFNITDQNRQEWNNQLEAIKTKGMEQIDSIYNPIETNLKNDIASRFGNFDNSVFMDNLNTITDKKAKAVSDLSNNLVSVQSQLYNEELSNRINTLSFLNNLNSVMNNNILNFTNAAMSNSSSGNSYNNAAYNANSSSGGFLNGASSLANTFLTGATALSTGANAATTGIAAIGALKSLF